MTSDTVANNAIVRARINGRIKDEATLVLAAMGLTVSDAFRLLLTRVAQDKNLPFTPLVPNKKTLAALEAAKRGEMVRVKSRKELFEQLDAED